MPPKNKSKEEILARKRELERKRYERIKNNPELAEIYKNKNKEKYQNRKQRGLVPLINSMSQTEKCMQRKIWREMRQKYYQRKKEEKERMERFMNSVNQPENQKVQIEIKEESANFDITGQENQQIVENIAENLATCSRELCREASPCSLRCSPASSTSTGSSRTLAIKQLILYKKDKEINSLRLQLQTEKKINDKLRKENMRQRKILSTIEGLLNNTKEPSHEQPDFQDIPIISEKSSNNHATPDFISVPEKLSHQSSMNRENKMPISPSLKSKRKDFRRIPSRKTHQEKSSENNSQSECLESEEEEDQPVYEEQAEFEQSLDPSDYTIATSMVEVTDNNKQFSGYEDDPKAKRHCTEVEDEYDAIGINVAAKLRNLPHNMKILAEKLINDVLFQAQLNGLHPSTTITTPDPFKQDPL